MIDHAIIFDLDGTLLDSAEDILLSLKGALDATGFAIRTPLSRHIIGPPIESIFQRMGLTAQQSSSALEEFRSLYDGGGLLATIPFSGVNETLDLLKAQGVALFVATNKPIKATRFLVDRSFPGLFLDICCIDSIPGRTLTKGDMIRYLAERHSLKPERTTVVGDGVSDIHGASANGFESVGVSYGYGIPKELLEAGARKVIDSFSELISKDGDYHFQRCPHRTEIEGET